MSGRRKLVPNKKPFRLPLGERGEMVGWDYLRRRGYKILEKNYRTPIGEIDVIAQKDGRIVFLEIKTRSNSSFGRPEESVDTFKQRKLIRIAQWYLKKRKMEEAAVSFDVLAVDWKGNAEPQMRLIENAFSADDWLT